MIREALDRMALGERAVLVGVEVERVSLFRFRVGGEVLDAQQASVKVFTLEARKCKPKARTNERLKAGDPTTDERIAELRRQHGRALRVTGGARAKRARWTKQEAWLVVSYPKEA